MFRAPVHRLDFHILTPALFLEESSWDLSLRTQSPNVSSSWCPTLGRSCKSAITSLPFSLAL